MAALRLAREVSSILATRGRKVFELKVSNRAPDDAELLRHLLGPTGKLRAPVLRHGKKLIVGFDAEAWASVLARPVPKGS